MSSARRLVQCDATDVKRKHVIGDAAQFESNIQCEKNEEIFYSVRKIK